MKVLLFITVILSGLVAGLLYSYACSVNGGLKALQDSEYLKAMQSINRAILNPFFFISFIGILFIYPLALYRLYANSTDNSFYILLAAAIIYIVGVFGITMFGNVPLNNQLDKFSFMNVSENQVRSMRLIFEKPWNNYHLVRTIASVLSFCLSVLAIIKQKF